MKLTPHDLVNFLEGLRDRHGFSIGVREHLRAEQLRGMLVARKKELEVDGWINHLAPAVCSSIEEQKTLRDAFLEFTSPERNANTSGRRSRQSTSYPLSLASRQDVRSRSKNAFRIAFYTTIGLLSAAVAFFLMRRGHDDPAPNGAPRGTWSYWPEVDDFLQSDGLFVRIIAITLPWVLLALFHLWRHDRRLALQRSAAYGASEATKYRFGTTVSHHFPLAQVSRHLSALQRRWYTGTSVFAVKEFIAAVARRAGFAEPQMHRRTIQPGYLLLVRQRGRSDHLAAAGLELAELLVSAGISVRTYVYANHPAFVSPLSDEGGTDVDSTVPLTTVLEAYVEAIVLVVEDGTGLLNPLTLEPLPWATALLQRRRPTAVMSSAAIQTWGVRERALHGVGFLVVSCDGVGLVELCRAIADLQREDVIGVPPSVYAAERRSLRSQLGNYPPLLRTSAVTFMARRPPSPSVVRQLMRELRDYLSPVGFVWLAGLAVYPDVAAELTRTIGSQLATAADRGTRPDAQTYLALARLPWLTHGFMPDWLRRAFLTALSKQEGHQVRQALNAILMHRLSRGRVALHFAQPKTLWQRAKQLVAGRPASHDAVFVRFMSKQQGTLSVPAPDWLGSSARRRWLSPIVTTVSIAFAAGVSIWAVSNSNENLNIVLSILWGLMACWSVFRAHVPDDTISRSGYILLVLAVIVVASQLQSGKDAEVPLVLLTLFVTTFAARYLMQGDRTRSRS